MRVANEEQVARAVNARLARASQVIERIDEARLAKEQREMLSSLRDFMGKASEALQAKDLARAQVLSEKAARLADDLALALKISR
jgi:hypothetical protein